MRGTGELDDTEFLRIIYWIVRLVSSLCFYLESITAWKGWVSQPVFLILFFGTALKNRCQREFRVFLMQEKVGVAAMGIKQGSKQ